MLPPGLLRLFRQGQAWAEEAPFRLTRLLVVRHARTALNAQGILQGPWLDPPLDTVGRMQALLLGQRLAATPFASVWSSPLRRAVETAEPAARASSAAFYEDDRLLEIDWGDWNGLRKDGPLLRDVDALARRWAAGDLDARPPRGESAAEALGRARAAVRDATRSAPRGSDVVLVAHGRLNRLLVSWLAHGDASQQDAFPASNAGLTILAREGRRWHPERVDCRAHLDDAPQKAGYRGRASGAPCAST